MTRDLVEGKGLLEPVAILTYHSLDRSGSVISIDPGIFTRQMRALASRGFEGIRLDRLLRAREGRATLPERAVAVTFDDGYANVLEEAAPVLEDLGFGATVFVIAGRLGRDNRWPGQPPAIPRLPLLDAAGLRSLAAQGFEIGSHSLTHRPLDGLEAGDLEREIVDPGRLLEDLLGQAVTSFAYPYGKVSREALAQVRETYLGACGTRLRIARHDDDPHLLPRVDMYYFRGRWTSRTVGTRAGAFYLRCRALGRALRSALRRS